MKGEGGEEQEDGCHYQQRFHVTLWKKFRFNQNSVGDVETEKSFTSFELKQIVFYNELTDQLSSRQDRRELRYWGSHRFSMQDSSCSASEWLLFLQPGNPNQSLFSCANPTNPSSDGKQSEAEYGWSCQKNQWVP